MAPKIVIAANDVKRQTQTDLDICFHLAMKKEIKKKEKEEKGKERNSFDYIAATVNSASVNRVAR